MNLKAVKITRTITYTPTDHIIQDLFNGELTQQEFAEWVKEYSDEDFDNWNYPKSEGIEKTETMVIEYQ